MAADRELLRQNFGTMARSASEQAAHLRWAAVSPRSWRRCMRIALTASLLSKHRIFSRPGMI